MEMGASHANVGPKTETTPGIESGFTVLQALNDEATRVSVPGINPGSGAAGSAKPGLGWIGLTAGQTPGIW